MKLHHAGAVLGAALLFSGCTVKGDEEDTTTSGEAETGVVSPPPATPTPTPAPSAIETAIRTQAGPDATSVDLIRANVVGGVLTVALTYRKPSESYDCCRYIDLDDVSVIDDATSQRIGVLKDDTGKWMAAPLNNGNGNQIRFPIEDGVAQVWFKFPAPSAGAKSVSINIPEVLPFDAVPLER